jgi:putative oxidoreductase
LQRLFSNFANGWPGAGILLQRGLVGILLVWEAVAQLSDTSHATSLVLGLVAALSGVFLLLGLWTPISGLVAAMVELVIVIAQTSKPLVPVVLGTLSASIAMIGPGAWSLDARFFGRKHIDTRHPSRSRGSGLG